MQSSITVLKPMSLPPTVIGTSVVEELGPDSWPDSTFEVVAPEQALPVNEVGALAESHRYG
jgi:hypothetical protein